MGLPSNTIEARVFSSELSLRAQRGEISEEVFWRTLEHDLDLPRCGLTWQEFQRDWRDAAWVEDDASARRVARTVGIAFIAHLVDLSSLYVIFLAFRTPVDFGVLVAGYAMGILFWIVSPTPQGIGVVEGVMALV